MKQSSTSRTLGRIQTAKIKLRSHPLFIPRVLCFNFGTTKSTTPNARVQAAISIFCDRQNTCVGRYYDFARQDSLKPVSSMRFPRSSDMHRI